MPDGGNCIDTNYPSGKRKYINIIAPRVHSSTPFTKQFLDVEVSSGSLFTIYPDLLRVAKIYFPPQDNTMVTKKESTNYTILLTATNPLEPLLEQFSRLSVSEDEQINIHTTEHKNDGLTLDESKLNPTSDQNSDKLIKKSDVEPNPDIEYAHKSTNHHYISERIKGCVEQTDDIANHTPATYNSVINKGVETRQEDELTTDFNRFNRFNKIRSISQLAMSDQNIICTKIKI